MKSSSVSVLAKLQFLLKLSVLTFFAMGTCLAGFAQGSKGKGIVNTIEGSHLTMGPMMVPRADGTGVDEIKMETAYFVVRGTEKEKLKMLRDIDVAAKAAKRFFDDSIKNNPNIKKFVMILNPEDQKSKNKVQKIYSNKEFTGKIAEYMGGESSSEMVFQYQDIERASVKIHDSVAIAEKVLPEATIVSMDVTSKSRQRYVDSQNSEKNGIKEWGMAVFRGTINGAGVLAGVTILPSAAADGGGALPLEVGLSAAAISGMMSMFLQLKQIPFTKWMSGAGILRPSFFRKASFMEGLLKDAILTAGYVGAVLFVRGVAEATLPMTTSGFEGFLSQMNMEYLISVKDAVKEYLIDPTGKFIHRDLIEAALVGGLSEGVWNTNIGHKTKQFISMNPDKKELGMARSRKAAVALSFVGTVGTVLTGMGIELGGIMLFSLAVTGGVYDIKYVGNLKRLYNDTLENMTWLRKKVAKPFNATQRRARRCEAAILSGI